MPYKAQKDRRYVLYGRIYEPDRPSAIDRWFEAKGTEFLSWFLPTPRKDGTRSGWFTRHTE